MYILLHYIHTMFIPHTAHFCYDASSDTIYLLRSVGSGVCQIQEYYIVGIW